MSRRLAGQDIVLERELGPLRSTGRQIRRLRRFGKHHLRRRLRRRGLGARGLAAHLFLGLQRRRAAVGTAASRVTTEQRKRREGIVAQRGRELRPPPPPPPPLRDL